MAKRKVDFGDVDPEIRKGGRSKHIPAGDYLVKIVSSEWREGKKADYINWRFQVVSGEHKGATLYGNTSLSRDALWNLRNLIHAATGKNVAGKAVNFDPENLVGKRVTATVEDDEYDGKLRSVPVDFRSEDEYEASETEDSDDDETEVEVEDEDEELEDVEVEDL